MILICNDDGIRAPGLKVLEGRLRELGDTFVVAPEEDQSAVSHALTLRNPLRVRRVEEGWFSVNGTPTDCINIALNSILNSSRPDLVVSGVNEGENLGDDIIYSGTVSAAMEAALYGIPAMAVSLVGREEFDHPMAAEITLKIAKSLLALRFPRPSLLNVNIPNVPAGELRGVRITKLGKRLLGNPVVEKVDPRGEKYYWIGGAGEGWEDVKGTDFEAVGEMEVSITPLRIDLTDSEAIGALAELKVEL